jgi:hypothetical protein
MDFISKSDFSTVNGGVQKNPQNDFDFFNNGDQQ